MQIIMKKEDFARIVAVASSKLPEEACGLIAGQENEDGKLVEKVYFLTNIDHSREHFSMDPSEQLQAIKDMRSNGWKPLGNWHSHPETPARPSEEDKRLAYDSQASYLILSLQDQNNPVLRAFHIDKDKNVGIEDIKYTNIP